ncbi:MAG: resuscitation-promoting factor RpfA [Acidimicrobiaceae bacterium]|nr:resuscitation-promoting factor RpfA [Acidimicrobiaceae bacterium]
MALTGERSTVEARTATGGFRGRRPIAVAGFAPLALSLLTSLLLPLGGVSAAGADPAGPDQAKVATLTARINAQAGRIHQLTGQLDQARLKVDSTSSRLVGVTKQHDTTMQVLGANRAILLEQAVRAYMHGGATPGMPSAAAASDVTLGQEYLRVASGDLANTSDQLRQLESDLRRDITTLHTAQQANLTATVQLQALRTNALAIAAEEQVQLDSLQTQLSAEARATAAANAANAATNAGGASGAQHPAAVKTTQGLPVNNGLVAVVQQAAGLPVATAVATQVTKPPAPAPPPPTSGGGHAGGVWLSLRRCESSDTYTENTGNGYFGAYQFSQGTWSGLGYPGRPDQESPAMQDEAAVKLQALSGWGQWPACAAALGLL